MARLAWFALIWFAVIWLVSCGGTAAPRPVDAERSVLILLFGMLSDVQYAGKATVGKRRSRDGLVNLANCIEFMSTHDLGFIVHCGDFIDGRRTADQAHEDLSRRGRHADELPARSGFVNTRLRGGRAVRSPRALRPRIPRRLRSRIP